MFSYLRHNVEKHYMPRWGHRVKSSWNSGYCFCHLLCVDKPSNDLHFPREQSNSSKMDFSSKDLDSGVNRAHDSKLKIQKRDVPSLTFLTETLNEASGMVKANSEVMWRSQGREGEEFARKEQTAHWGSLLHDHRWGRDLSGLDGDQRWNETIPTLKNLSVW